VDPVRRLPGLDAPAKQALYGGWSDQHNVVAAGQLPCRHLRLVAEHRGRQIASQGLAAEESIGLMASPCSYIGASGAGFMAYEARWERAAIRHSVLRAVATIAASEPAYPAGSTCNSAMSGTRAAIKARPADVSRAGRYATAFVTPHHHAV